MAQHMKIAIVDDEQDMRQSISQWLALSGFDTETFASAEDALKAVSPDYPGVVVSDIKMPGMDGMSFLKRLMSIDSALPVIMITGQRHNKETGRRIACDGASAGRHPRPWAG
jgi:DNA-binding NtrC family response regulator